MICLRSSLFPEVYRVGILTKDGKFLFDPDVFNYYLEHRYCDEIEFTLQSLEEDKEAVLALHQLVALWEEHPHTSSKDRQEEVNRVLGESEVNERLFVDWLHQVLSFILNDPTVTLYDPCGTTNNEVLTNVLAVPPAWNRGVHVGRWTFRHDCEKK